ncbi:MAG: uroporphyrinogen decarboxylase [Flavobacteriales bacterium]|jgi:uroporphyrinogen decarboxylase|nr:uroporphyrinogen decarboxylase [Flavobacteriales bacterium]MBT3964379.1 uroporphyrinogen decarboxylase [Flavobacteriales bacterium]MBT4704971.1 uroporphyrinogen decarboxylase [Flavobacteriales bacterium]MBT4929746.1 uroporphyrinogen decarboxylase [Flavobacteriales bacterium]MBT5132812.1 uroporphyrinogen decarboxylase [Flavobacteriales bacterium]
MAEFQNDLLVHTARGEKCERSPVWVMRQAGRILPEYREVRKSLSGFKELVETPDLAAEVTVQPVDILGVDAAIIFSDILVIPEAMGLTYEMKEGFGPFFPRTIKGKADIDQLRTADGSELRYVYDAISETRKRLNGRVPVIGFAGAPFTILCYMIEGQGSKTFSNARRWLHSRPAESHQLLEMITESTINYLKLQVEAGVSLYQVFDSWAGVLSESLYREFCMPYLNRIAQEINEVPSIVFAKGAHFAMEDLMKSEFNAVGLDWTMKPEDMRQLDSEKVLQGNLDPCLLYANDDEIVNKTNEMLNSFSGGAHIANLGHGVYPDTEWQKVKLFIDTIKNSSN